MNLKSILQKLKDGGDKKQLQEELSAAIKEYTDNLDSKSALEFIFGLENDLYQLAGLTSIRHGGGIHSKHRHVRYHDFFTKNLKSGNKVLDIGSSVGELTYDIAKKANPGKVIGIEIEGGKVEEAKKLYQLDNLEFVIGDATKDLPDEKFDVITLSNVLEHIEKRPELLKILNNKYKPKKFLIRVPMYERDWRVPLKDELGMDYRLDDTHFIEYTNETFDTDMHAAGLEVASREVKWGETWAVVVPQKRK